MTRGMSRPADGRAARSAGASEHGRCGVLCPLPSAVPHRPAPPVRALLQPRGAAGPAGANSLSESLCSGCFREEMAFEEPEVPPHAGWRTIPLQIGSARCFSKQELILFYFS